MSSGGASKAAAAAAGGARRLLGCVVSASSVEASVRWYVDVLKMVRRGGGTPGGSAFVAFGVEGTAGFRLEPAAAARPPAAAAVLPTVTVSNMESALRNATRRGGVVVTAVRARGGGSDAPVVEAVLGDPDGARVRVLHAYRRAPLRSLALIVPDVRAAAGFFATAMGLRAAVGDARGEVEGGGASLEAGGAELHLLPLRADEPASEGVLLFAARAGDGARPLYAPGGVHCELL